jgi:DNA helicase-2/ATP-dependent DNA helicase PcrA
VNRRAIVATLNKEQRHAVETVSGPVCILAGAGSGKTTTITHRIANQVAAGAFSPEQILAVTFTDKAAGEMRDRLEQLGVRGVRARTFHAAALGQLHHLRGRPVGAVLPSKALAVRQLANRLPRPYRFRSAGDLANEIEWAKNRRIGPNRYLEALGDHEPPIPSDLMHRLYRDYERGKDARGLIDFEDLLEHAIEMFDDDEQARDRFRERYRAFTVDEFQDVNLLQHSLLDQWMGDRDELCAVGDDYQSIYGFTGASPEYLLALPARWPNATVVRLETNYRSTPDVLALANRLVPKLGGARKVLRPQRPSGPKPAVTRCSDEASEPTHIVERIKALRRNGVALEEIAILYRANYRSEEFEERLAQEHIPFQVRDGAFLSRQAARRMTSRFENSSATGVAHAVRAAAEREGWSEETPDGPGEQELTRQKDLTRLVRLAEEFDHENQTLGAFVYELRQRFGTEAEGRGVNLLTYHRAKGLEFEAVFLPRLNEGEMPFKRARSDAAVAEERRLLYVGMTRAKVVLELTWVAGGKLQPSRFLVELGVLGSSERGSNRASKKPASPMSLALRTWRGERARSAGVPAYVILHDRTLEEIARRKPRTKRELAGVSGIGPLRLDGYGDEILAVVEQHR